MTACCWAAREKEPVNGTAPAGSDCVLETAVRAEWKFGFNSSASLLGAHPTGLAWTGSSKSLSGEDRLGTRLPLPLLLPLLL